MFLRHEQGTLLEQLRRRSESLAAIYMGGLRVLADDGNPTRYHLAAHAFRELLSNCSELTGAPPEHGDGMKQRLAPVRDAFAALKRSNETNTFDNINEARRSIVDQAKKHAMVVGTQGQSFD